MSVWFNKKEKGARTYQIFPNLIRPDKIKQTISNYKGYDKHLEWIVNICNEQKNGGPVGKSAAKA
jgi:hypothetical protein